MPLIAFRLALRAVLLTTAVLGLAGCQSIEDLFSSEEPKLPGERVSVLALESTLEPDERVQDLEVILPPATVNPDWPQPGGRTDAVMQHVALGANLTEAWSTDIGSTTEDEERIVVRPVVSDGRVFTMDARGLVSAIDLASGEIIWQVGLARRSESLGEVGGGLAVGEGRLAATTAYGDIYLLDPATGRYYWEQRTDGPLRGAPTIDNGRVYYLASENRLVARDLESGEELWQHQGIIEAAELMGAPAPTGSGPYVIAPYSSGEIYALRADTGQALWSDQLVRARRITPLGSINDVDGQPVVDGERVYAVSHGGYLAAIDLRRGARLWDQDMSGRETPWLAGEFLYLVSNESELVCVSTRDGGIRWVTQMQKFEDEEERRGRITWHGPVLAGERLLVAGSEGTLWSMSPFDGSALGSISFDDGIPVAPVVARETLLVLTDDGQLHAYR